MPGRDASCFLDFFSLPLAWLQRASQVLSGCIVMVLRVWEMVRENYEMVVTGLTVARELFVVARDVFR